MAYCEHTNRRSDTMTYPLNILIPTNSKVAVTTANGGRIAGRTLYPSTMTRRGEYSGMTHYSTLVLVGVEGVANPSHRVEVSGPSIEEVVTL